jgi:hypothetical protein
MSSPFHPENKLGRGKGGLALLMPGIRLSPMIQNILQIQIPTDWGAGRWPFTDPLFATLHFARRVTDVIHLDRLTRDFHLDREQESFRI